MRCSAFVRLDRRSWQTSLSWITQSAAGIPPTWRQPCKAPTQSPRLRIRRSEAKRSYSVGGSSLHSQRCGSEQRDRFRSPARPCERNTNICKRDDMADRPRHLAGVIQEVQHVTLSVCLGAQHHLHGCRRVFESNGGWRQRAHGILHELEQFVLPPAVDRRAEIACEIDCGSLAEAIYDERGIAGQSGDSVI